MNDHRSALATPRLPAVPAAALEGLGRALLASLFLVAGVGKLGSYAATQGYMTAMHVPGALLPLVIALEIGGGLALLLGLLTRLTAVLLAVFCVISGLIFHAGSAEPLQQAMLLKNLALAGAFLLLALHGAGPWSLDALRRRRA